MGFFALFGAAATAQGLGKREVRLPELEVPAPPQVYPRPTKEFSVLSSKVQRLAVVKEPPMTGLPAVEGIVDFTVQLVGQPALPEEPVSSSADPSGQELESAPEQYRGTEIVLVSATVYDHRRTFLRILTIGGEGGEVSAWSNLDFNHFTGIPSFRVTYADGAYSDACLLMGIGNTEALPGDEIPEMPGLDEGGPSYLIASGSPESKAGEALWDLHKLFQKEGQRMVSESRARALARQKRAEHLLTNPPKPENVTVRFWKKSDAGEGGDR